MRFFSALPQTKTTSLCHPHHSFVCPSEKFICSMCFSYLSSSLSSHTFFHNNPISVGIKRTESSHISFSSLFSFSLSKIFILSFAQLFLFSFSLGFDFGFHLILINHPLYSIENIFFFCCCCCCSYKKAHDINFPPNSRHRRLWHVKSEREREGARTEGQKNASKAKSIFTNDKHMKYFCMIE